MEKTLTSELVIWEDHVGLGMGDNWVSLHDAQELELKKNWSLGFVIKETEKSITLAMTIDCPSETEDVGGVLCIDKRCILKRRTLPTEDHLETTIPSPDRPGQLQ